MKFENIKIEFEEYEILDIIAASEETETETPTEATTKYDPYENDKW